jgi:hypothetical protein
MVEASLNRTRQVTSIDIAKEFTRFPAGRYRKNGTTSGEEFRERFLEESLRRGEVVRVKLDGTIGYGSSFLEEAFGGLVRSLDWDSAKILQQLELESSDPALVAEIKQYVRDAGNVRGRSRPHASERHVG